ncbi:MAG TPA: CopD family protein, partial [Gemmatimonadaceae bacterium]|nr:CopD family protein [Gemmatimonadaceae bacterium]
GGNADESGQESVANVVARFFSFVALLVLIGVASFRWLTIPSANRISARHSRAQSLGASRDLMLARSARLGSVAAVLLLAAAIVRSYLESYAIHGATDAMKSAMLRSMLFETTWGNAWLVQVGAALLAGIALALVSAAAVQGRRGTPWWTIATVSIIVLAFTPAFGGHAVASPRLRSLAVLSDGLHVLGAGGWLGTLLIVVAVGLPIVLSATAPDRGGMAADLINAFSPAALAFASLIVLTGVGAAWLHIGSWATLWRSAYGRALLIKIGVLLPVIGTGAYNWLRIRPVLGDVAAAHRLRRSATMELIIGSAVVLVTAVLVALQTPIE